MSQPRECPSSEQLHQLAVGSLPDPPATEVETHLLECSVCQEATAGLNVSDTFVEAMRTGAKANQAAAGSCSAEDQARVERLVADLSSLRSLPSDVPSPTLSSSAAPTELFAGRDGEANLLVELSKNWQPAQQPDELGRLGGYRVLKLLGAGGMGGVFLAEDPQLRRQVALKVMRPHVAATPGAAQRFLREARAAAALRHDHIITIYQTGEEAGVPFLAMEYLEGESLDDRLRRASGPLPIEETFRIGQQIAEGLAAAHDHGLIHRDIKPANVWLESSPVAPRQDSRRETSAVSPHDASGANQPFVFIGVPVAERQGYGRVKLLDFGLARGMDDDVRITTSGMIVGTPSYMAPEQASGEEVDQRADLFSLGCVLYRMTTGRLPFPGTKALEVLQALATITPLSPHAVNPDVPPPLSDLIDRLLQKDRRARPASAREVASALRQLRSPVAPRLGFAESDATITEILPQPSSTAPNASRGTTRLRWLIATALAACLLFGVIIIKLRDKDGRETKITLDAPPGTKVVSVEESDSDKANPSSKPDDKVRSVAVASPLDALDPSKIPDAERFEWQPKELVAVLGGHAWRHWGPVLSVSSNPDGSLIASAGEFDGVRLWDGSTGKQLAAWPGTAVAFSANGEKLVIRAATELVIVDLKSREIQAKFKTASYPPMLGVSSDANTLAVASTDSIQVFDAKANQQILNLPYKDFTQSIGGISLSADGKMLAAACAEGLKLWNVATGQSHPAPDVKTFPGMTFSPDGKAVAFQAENGKIQIWNLQTLRVEAEFVAGHPHHRSLSLAFSRDGQTLASGGSSGSVSLWDVSNGQVKEFREVQADVHSVAFTADGRTLMCGGADAAVRLCDTETLKQTNTIQGHSSQVSLLALAPDDRVLAVAGPTAFGLGRVALWDVVAGREQNSWLADYTVAGLAIGPDGKTLATVGNLGIRLWDLPSGEQQQPLQDNMTHSLKVKFSSDKTTVSAILLAPQANEIRTWDIVTRKMKSSFSIGERNGYATFTQSPDGTQFVYCDQSLHAWDAVTQTKRWTVTQTEGLTMPFMSPVYSRDGKKLLVVRYGDGNIAPTIYDAATGQFVESYLRGHTDNYKPPTCAIFLPDDKTIISAGMDGQIIEWTSPRQRRVLCKLPGPVLNLVLATDGRHLFTANGNGTVYVLRLNLPERSHDQVPALADPDRRAAEYIVSIGGHVQVRRNDQESQLRAVADLPTEPFELTRVGIGEPAGLKITDAGLAHFHGCQHLTELRLNCKPVTDAGVLHFQDCKHLKTLSLQFTRVTDAGLANFADCVELNELNLNDTKVSGAGLVHFKGCINLKELKLADAPLTDAGLAQIKDLRNIETLTVTETKVSDAGLVFVKGLTKLQDLTIDKTSVSSRGLENLAGLTQLTRLGLSSTLIDDAGLIHLSGLTSLTNLGLRKTKVTESGVAKLRKALPQCKIETDFGTFEPTPTDAKPRPIVAAKPLRNPIGETTSPVGPSALVLHSEKIPGSERFDWQPKELVAVLGGHAWRHWGDVLSVSSNPDGSLIASAGRNDGVRLWDATGKQVAAWPGLYVAFSADGERLFIGRDGEVAVVDVESREARNTIKTTTGPTFIALSDDANTLATWSAEALQVFDVTANKQLLRLPLGEFTTDLRVIALSPNGKTLAAACIEGLKLWDAATGQSLAAPEVKDIPAVVFSPDNSRVAIQGPGEIQIWNLQTREIVAKFVADHPHHRSRCLAFSRDGKLLASGGHNSTECWDVETGKAKPPMSARRDANAIAFTADGQTLVTGGFDAAVRLWNVATGQQTNAVSGYQSQVSLIALTPNDRLMAVAGPGGFGNGRIVLWDILTGGEQKSWLADDEVSGLAIDHQGSTLATAGYSGVRLWDLPAGKQQPPLHENLKARAVKFMPDGKTLSAVSIAPEGNEVRSWQVSTGKLNSSFRVGPPDEYQHWLELSPDGTLFAYGDSVWEAATQKMKYSEVKQYGVGRLAQGFSHDGKRLLAIRLAEYDNSGPTIYDTTTGEVLESFRGGHQGHPTCAIFLRDDKTIISAGYDGQIIEWTSPRQRRVLCRLPGPVLSLVLASDGRHLFTANSNGTVYVLRLNEPQK